MSEAERENLVLQSWKFRLVRGNVSATTPGLSISFSRPQQTIDPTGVVCDPTTGTTEYTKARYDRAFRLSPVPAPTARIDAHYTSLVLASGLAANGTDELMVYLDFDYTADLSVFNSANGCDTPWATPLKSDLFMGTTALNVSNTAPRCLALPEYDPALKWFNPLSAVVIHGAIILAGPVLIPDPGINQAGKWTYGGWGFAINRDAGDPAKWHRLWDDLATDPKQVYYNRGQAWCLKACAANNRTLNPTQFWLCCTDYRVQPGNSGNPDGGRVYVARMARTDGGSSDWHIDSDGLQFKTFDLSQGTPDDTLLPIAGCHAHAAYIAEYGPISETTYPDVQLIVSLGDSQQNNRIARLIWDDSQTVNHDFTLGWTLADGFHGRVNTPGTPTNDRGTWSFQPVGVASGLLAIQKVLIGGELVPCHKPSLVWGGDVEAEWLVNMTPPTYGSSPDQLTCEHLWGWSTGFGSKRDGYLNWPYFLIGTVTESRPEAFGPLVAVAYDTTSDGPPPPPESWPPAPPPAGFFSDTEYLNSRVLFNPGVGTNGPGAWHQVGALRTLSLSQVVSAVYYCGHIYYTMSSSDSIPTDLPGLYKVPAPTDTTNFEPIIVSPGGENLVHTSYNAAGDTGDQTTSVSPLALQVPGTHDGRFSDGGTVLPACPTMADTAYKFVTTRAPTGTTKPYITRVHVSSASNTAWNDLSTKWAVGPQVRRYRGWVLDNSFDNLTPNKTIQKSSQFANVVVDGSGAPVLPNWAATTLYSCRDRWCPVTLIGYHDFKADLSTGDALALGMTLRSSWSGSEHPDDNNFYFVLDSAMDSFGSLPYPIVPTTGTVGTALDESLTITTGTGGPLLRVNSTAEWSVRLAGLLPEGDWDQYAQRIRDTDPVNPPIDRRFWPLYTLWGSDNTYFEFRADCVNRQFEVKAILNGQTYWSRFGGPDQFWLPNSQFYSVISLKRVVIGTTISYRFSFGASLGGGPVVPGPPIDLHAWPVNGPAFTQLRFRGGPLAEPTKAEKANEVVTMRWVGGEFLTGAGAAFTTDTEIQSAFSDVNLAWLKGP